jgi:hypothetical protein
MFSERIRWASTPTLQESPRQFVKRSRPVLLGEYLVSKIRLELAVVIKHPASVAAPRGKRQSAASFEGFSWEMIHLSADQ